MTGTLIAWGIGLVVVALFLKGGARGSAARDLDAGTVWKAAQEAEKAGTYSPPLTPRLKKAQRA